MKGMIILVQGRGYIIYESASAAITPAMITEEQRVIKFTAEIQEAETPNRNKRIYGKDAIDGAINHYTVQEKLKTKTFFGESAHPLSTDPRRQMYIDQRNISHIVTNMWWDGNKLMANVETADTLAGRDMRGLILQGSQAAFSMRGMSDNVRKDGQYSRVGSPLMIVGYDWVTLPSHQGSYMVKEGTELLSETVQSSMGKENQTVLSEGILTPYNTNEMLNYVAHNSRNVNELAEQFGFDIDTKQMSIDKDQVVSLKEGNDTLRVFLEESIKKDLDGYFSSFGM